MYAPLPRSGICVEEEVAVEDSTSIDDIAVDVLLCSDILVGSATVGVDSDEITLDVVSAEG